MTRILFTSRRLAKIYPMRATAFRAMEEVARLGVTGAVWFDLYLAMTMPDAGVRTIITENVSDFARIPFVSARSLDRFDGRA